MVKWNECFSQECFRLETTLKDLSQPVTGSILIADDQPANRELLEELLTREGFNVLTAGDGADALETVKSFRPDLVLLDVMMPKLSGFQVCEQIKADRETGLTPVILITALSNKEDRVAGIQAGADDFLTRPADRSELLARVRSLLKLKARTDELERAESVLFALARSIEGKDPYTQDHCDRLSQYAARLGECLGLPEEQLTALRRAAIVHDVGKVAVPDAILLKPGKLTDEEWNVMKEHPVVGERICSPLRAFRLVLPIIRHHHEKRDGSGYPDGLKGDAIPLGARILQIVDVYDALTTERPYKRAQPAAEALKIMQAEVDREWWDALIFEEFKKLAEDFSKSRAAGAGAS
jgi:putative two-component system response regulator